MQGVMRGFIRGVDTVNYRLGRIMMYGIFALMGVLLWSSVNKVFFLPSLWTLEMAQFIMVGYYILGGPYSMQMGDHVRMDLLYGDWSVRKKAWVDLFTVLLLIFYLVVLLYGAISSTAYSLGYWKTEPLSYLFGVVTGTEEIGRLEQSSSAWRPYLWPVKVVMIVGFFLMILQCLSELCKDVLRLKGHEI
ncbi:TRAP transporter small permease subunit [uncultured Pseudosulfitobacter sp.]|jgi:TRAP-type mannitol/chloroaromatic compound transport system permease small subunit|uniref:TRAP transporter small permease subunit n=1 Tax=uncultured Pseudosulfitobacter sp. TaxID=2854214 RepID=UPI0030D70698|tara:strand:- start:802 stop:1371 length:570 start_codon:yes stop_codon:yes gene_type:complete